MKTVFNISFTRLVVIGLVTGSLMSNSFSQPAGTAPAQGKALYEKYCSTCHGIDGKGEGKASVYLNPKPRDFTRGLFKFQSTPSGALPTDDDLLRTIRTGMPGSPMVAWDRLAETELKSLVAHVKTFSERFATETPLPALVIGDPPPQSPQLIREGKMVYALAGCWQCHGKTGIGDGPSAPSLADDVGRPIRPYNFTRAGAFKGGGTPKDIYKTFTTGIGGTPMPGYGEDALVPTKESFSDLTFLQSQYSTGEIKEVAQFVRQLPTAAVAAKMTAAQRKDQADARRWSLVYYVLSLAQGGKSQISYTTKDHDLTTMFVEDVAQVSDPGSSRWTGMPGQDLPLVSLWQRDTPIDRVTVQCVTDGKAIAIRLEWEDATRDDEALHVSRFGDAAAAQFPLDPSTEPFFAMGDTSVVVNIWHWKSWWEKDLQKFAGVDAAFPRNRADLYPFDVSGGSTAEYFVSRDSARSLSMTWNAGWGSGNVLSSQTRTTPVEDVNASGFGTLTSQPMKEQNVGGKGGWRNGKWTVVFVRALDPLQAKDVSLKVASTVPVAFAVWDGSLQDRNGQKMVTNWYRLSIGTK